MMDNTENRKGRGKKDCTSTCVDSRGMSLLNPGLSMPGGLTLLATSGLVTPGRARWGRAEKRGHHILAATK